MRRQCCRFMHTPEDTLCAIMWGLVLFFYVSVFSDQRRITMQLSLPMQDVITIRHQTGKRPKMKSTASAENKVLHQKKDILNTSQKLHILEGWGIFEFLSFSVRQLNSNESGRAAPANCARRVADLDVYSNDHCSTSECKLFYAST